MGIGHWALVIAGCVGGVAIAAPEPPVAGTSSQQTNASQTQPVVDPAPDAEDAAYVATMVGETVSVRGVVRRAADGRAVITGWVQCFEAHPLTIRFPGDGRADRAWAAAAEGQLVHLHGKLMAYSHDTQGVDNGGWVLVADPATDTDIPTGADLIPDHAVVEARVSTEVTMVGTARNGPNGRELHDTFIDGKPVKRLTIRVADSGSTPNAWPPHMENQSVWVRGTLRSCTRQAPGNAGSDELSFTVGEVEVGNPDWNLEVLEREHALAEALIDPLVGHDVVVVGRASYSVKTGLRVLGSVSGFPASHIETFSPVGAEHSLVWGKALEGREVRIRGRLVFHGYVRACTSEGAITAGFDGLTSGIRVRDPKRDIDVLPAPEQK